MRPSQAAVVLQVLPPGDSFFETAHWRRRLGSFATHNERSAQVLMHAQGHAQQRSFWWDDGDGVGVVAVVVDVDVDDDDGDCDGDGDDGDDDDDDDDDDG